MGDGKQRLRVVVLDAGDVVRQRVFVKVRRASPCLPHLLDQSADLANFGRMDVQVVDALFSESVGSLRKSFGALVGCDDAQTSVVCDGSPELYWDSAGSLMSVRSRRKAPIFCSF